jgi:hypothetical protein
MQHFIQHRTQAIYDGGVRENHGNEVAKYINLQLHRNEHI